MINAEAHLRTLVVRTIPTLTGKPNRVIAVCETEVVVGTERTPGGTPVPTAWVQAAIDQLLAKGELEINTPPVGYLG